MYPILLVSFIELFAARYTPYSPEKLTVMTVGSGAVTQRHTKQSIADLIDKKKNDLGSAGWKRAIAFHGVSEDVLAKAMSGFVTNHGDASRLGLVLEMTVEDVLTAALIQLVKDTERRPDSEFVIESTKKNMN